MCLFLFFRFFVQFSYFFSGFLRVFCVLLWFSSFVFHQFLFVSFLIFLRFFISHFPLIFVFLFLTGFFLSLLVFTVFNSFALFSFGFIFCLFVVPYVSF